MENWLEANELNLFEIHEQGNQLKPINNLKFTNRKYLNFPLNKKTRSKISCRMPASRPRDLCSGVGFGRFNFLGPQSGQRFWVQFQSRCIKCELVLSMTDKHCARKYSGSAAKCEIFEINLRNALRNLRNNLRTIINRPLEWERSLRGFGTLRKNNIFFLNRPLESERSLRGFGTLRKNTFLWWNPLFRQFSTIFGPRH